MSSTEFFLVPVSGGVLSQVHHFDSKAKVEGYIRSEGIPATFMLPGFYMSNIAGGNLRKTPEGVWKLALPIPGDSPIPLFASEYDTGKFVKSIFLKKDETLGKRIYAATKYYTPLEILATFKDGFPNAGKDAAFAELPHAVFKGILAGAGMPEIAQEELLENMRLMPEFGYYGGEALDSSIEVGLRFFHVNVSIYIEKDADKAYRLSMSPSLHGVPT
jgi:hypothetical protein